MTCSLAVSIITQMLHTHFLHANSILTPLFPNLEVKGNKLRSERHNNNLFRHFIITDNLSTETKVMMQYVIVPK